MNTTTSTNGINSTVEANRDAFMAAALSDGVMTIERRGRDWSTGQTMWAVRPGFATVEDMMERDMHPSVAIMSTKTLANVLTAIAGGTDPVPAKLRDWDPEDAEFRALSNGNWQVHIALYAQRRLISETLTPRQLAGWFATAAA